MGIRRTSFLFIIFILISAQLHLCSCRLINHTANEEKIRAKFYSFFHRYFSTIPQYSGWSKNTKAREFHTVSRRVVPCGPNPLHN